MNGFSSLPDIPTFSSRCLFCPCWSSKKNNTPLLCVVIWPCSRAKHQQRSALGNPNFTPLVVYFLPGRVFQTYRFEPMSHSPALCVEWTRRQFLPFRVFLPLRCRCLTARSCLWIGPGVNF